MGQAWEPSNKQCYFDSRRALDMKIVGLQRPDRTAGETSQCGAEVENALP
jgi:hypothetical protein